jgi:3-hydroxyisobutyrate dehydrogenase-like beta-hydroxyacid dehydrogenase
MAKGDFSPSFELAMARKDVRLMLEMSGDRPLAALPAVAARMDALMAAGHGARDASVMAIDALR